MRIPISFMREIIKAIDSSSELPKYRSYCGNVILVQRITGPHCITNRSDSNGPLPDIGPSYDCIDFMVNPDD